MKLSFIDADELLHYQLSQSLCKEIEKHAEIRTRETNDGDKVFYRMCPPKPRVTLV